MTIGSARLLEKYGTPTGVAKALLKGELSASEEGYASEIVSQIVLDAAKWQLEREAANRKARE